MAPGAVYTGHRGPDPMEVGLMDNGTEHSNRGLLQGGCAGHLAQSHVRSGRTPTLIAEWLRMVVEALADRLHAKGDAEARVWGWEVTRTPWGGRSYRDPRMSPLSVQGAGVSTRRVVTGRASRVGAYGSRVPR